MTAKITTADGRTLSQGDRAFNHYDQKFGVIEEVDRYAQPDPLKGQSTATPLDEWSNFWFRFRHDDGSSCSLDGSRIVSLEMASTVLTRSHNEHPSVPKQNERDAVRSVLVDGPLDGDAIDRLLEAADEVRELDVKIHQTASSLVFTASRIASRAQSGLPSDSEGLDVALTLGGLLSARLATLSVVQRTLADAGFDVARAGVFNDYLMSGAAS